MGKIASKQRLERSLRSLLMTGCSPIALSGFPQGHFSFCCLSQLKILHLFQPAAYINRYTHGLYVHHNFYQLEVSAWIYQHVSNFLLFKLVKYLCVCFFLTCHKLHILYRCILLNFYGCLHKPLPTYRQSIEKY